MGIGLARLRAWELTRSPSALADAGAALQAATLALEPMTAGDQPDPSLCHGLAGVAELFIVSAEVLGQPAHRTLARGVAEVIVDAREARERGAAACRTAARPPGS